MGDALPPFVVEAIDPTRMKTMAAILDDPNPIHFDVDVVRALRLGEQPVNQGPINLGLLMNVVLRHFGDPSALRTFRCRFLGNVFAGERFEGRAVITTVDASTGETTLALSAFAGERQVLEGTAVVRTSAGAPGSHR